MVTIAKLIPKNLNGISTLIDGIKYIGTEHFIIREDLCSKALKERVEKQFFREVSKDTFKYNKGDDYPYKEVETELYNGNTRLIDGKNYVYIQNTYYQYLKKLGFEFRFNSRIKPIGIFKDSEWVGMVLPMRIIIDGEAI